MTYQTAKSGSFDWVNEQFISSDLWGCQARKTDTLLGVGVAQGAKGDFTSLQREKYLCINSGWWSSGGHGPQWTAGFFFTNCSLTLHRMTLRLAAFNFFGRELKNINFNFFAKRSPFMQGFKTRRSNNNCNNNLCNYCRKWPEHLKRIQLR